MINGEAAAAQALAELLAVVSAAAQARVTCRHMLVEVATEEERVLTGVCGMLDDYWRSALGAPASAAVTTEALLVHLREEQEHIAADAARAEDQLSALTSVSAKWQLPMQQLRELRACVSDCEAMRSRMEMAQHEESAALTERTREMRSRADAVSSAADDAHALAALRDSNARARSEIALYIERDVLHEKIAERAAVLRELRTSAGLPPSPRASPRRLPSPRSSPEAVRVPLKPPRSAAAVESAPSSAASGLEWAASWERAATMPRARAVDAAAEAAATLRRRRDGMGLSGPASPSDADFARSTRALVERILAGAGAAPQ
jgi:hypothetical protein